VIEKKLAAMAEMKAQQYLQTYYEQRASSAATTRGAAAAAIRTFVTPRRSSG
jgi:hypothetical protein